MSGRSCLPNVAMSNGEIRLEWDGIRSGVPTGNSLDSATRRLELTTKLSLSSNSESFLWLCGMLDVAFSEGEWTTVWFLKIETLDRSKKAWNLNSFCTHKLLVKELLNVSDSTVKIPIYKELIGVRNILFMFGKIFKISISVFFRRVIDNNIKNLIVIVLI